MKIDCHLEVFLLGSQVLFFILISKVFIGISGKSFKIQFLAIFYIVILMRDLITFETEFFLFLLYQGFHSNIRGTVFGNILYGF